MTLSPCHLSGTLPANPSKSCAHRVLIATALAQFQSGLRTPPAALNLPHSSLDIIATQTCLDALARAMQSPCECILPCNESGSTLRFLLPVAAALLPRIQSHSATFTAEGRLPQRPLEPLFSQLTSHGVSATATFPLTITGALSSSTPFAMRGDVSSQYFTGLLFALPILPNDTSIAITTPLESAGYIDLTLATLRDFGIKIYRKPDAFEIPGNQRYIMPAHATVEGDWSSAAFWLAANELGADINLTGLNPDSAQADRAIIPLLIQLRSGDCTLDLSQSPDIFPILAIVAGFRPHTTRFVNCSRLRLKECDRLAAMAKTLTQLGAEVQETEDSLTVRGHGAFLGGTFSSYADHRIAMSLAIAATVASSPITILGAECVSKSYPHFFEDFQSLS